MSIGSGESFRHHAIGYWACVDQADPDGATAHTESLERVAAEMSADELITLLRDSDERVRYAAAASLGASHEGAVTTLLSLASDPSGLIAPTANLLLRTWGRS